MFVSCHMPKKVRVGRSDFLKYLKKKSFLPKGILLAKLEENPDCKKNG